MQAERVRVGLVDYPSTSEESQQVPPVRKRRACAELALDYDTGQFRTGLRQRLADSVSPEASDATESNTRVSQQVSEPVPSCTNNQVSEPICCTSSDLSLFSLAAGTGKQFSIPSSACRGRVQVPAVRTSRPEHPSRVPQSRLSTTHHREALEPADGSSSRRRGTSRQGRWDCRRRCLAEGDSRHIPC